MKNVPLISAINKTDYVSPEENGKINNAADGAPDSFPGAPSYEWLQYEVDYIMKTDYFEEIRNGKKNQQRIWNIL